MSDMEARLFAPYTTSDGSDDPLRCEAERAVRRWLAVEDGKPDPGSAPSPVREGGALSDLLGRVHVRLGGVGVDLTTYGTSDEVEVSWRRDYGHAGLSDRRTATAAGLAGALQAVLDYEEEADKLDAEEAS